MGLFRERPPVQGKEHRRDANVRYPIPVHLSRQKKYHIRTANKGRKASAIEIKKQESAAADMPVEKQSRLAVLVAASVLWTDMAIAVVDED